MNDRKQQQEAAAEIERLAAKDAEAFGFHPLPSPATREEAIRCECDALAARYAPLDETEPQSDVWTEAVDKVLPFKRPDGNAKVQGRQDDE